VSKQHWSKKKGVISGAQAQQRAAGAHRKEAIKGARKGAAPPPEYTETRSGFLALFGRRGR